jgi:16S rRNA C967 or C1407 C5-methylase (RsmB/RsmF family)
MPMRLARPSRKLDCGGSFAKFDRILFDKPLGRCSAEGVVDHHEEAKFAQQVSGEALARSMVSPDGASLCRAAGCGNETR